MGLFFVNAGFLSLLAALEFIPVASQPDRRCASKKLLLVIGLSYLCFLAMFRGAACGNDTADYIEFFSENRDADDSARCHPLHQLRAAVYGDRLSAHPPDRKRTAAVYRNGIVFLRRDRALFPAVFPEALPEHVPVFYAAGI